MESLVDEVEPVGSVVDELNPGYPDGKIWPV